VEGPANSTPVLKQSQPATPGLPSPLPVHVPAQQSKALTTMAATSPVKSPSSPASLPQIPSLAKYKLGKWRRRTSGERAPMRSIHPPLVAIL